MARHLIVRHITEYRYREPVSFGRHRMMFRPRDSHTLRLLDTGLQIFPKPERVRWMYDVFGNSIAYADFGEQRSETLRFESEIGILHYESAQPTRVLLEPAERYPFVYSNEEYPDLEAVIKTHTHPGNDKVAAWARQIVDNGSGETLDILSDMMVAIRRDVGYRRRSSMGTQHPSETLDLTTGTCRDFAWLMIEALRSLGFAARFVSGYIYSPSRASHQGGGATHAWVQVYLPGCGWIEMDPTNGIFGNRDLIRIAVARHPSQARPLSGIFNGSRAAYSGLTVSVNVTNAGPSNEFQSSQNEVIANAL